MTSLGWVLLARVVDIETWMHLVLPSAAAHPIAALLVLTVGTAVAMVLVHAADRVICVVFAIDIALWSVASASRPQPDLRPQMSVMLASGHGPRAPGRLVRRPAART
ncbi:hypothetical protein [Curtobacterium sp. MCBD17_028]|uniref:hypothetical protein n=1 Tax=Curtobacterium sp. MCBD17_028 TaxID=2175670 RepID=UPI000DB4208C|nr:hypothetical protein [Curtobacterium sp. MCBD17_028]PZE29759.1 hypothetical protein DEI86_00155 [Curtobacterium sp. MCBD17_028]